MRARVFASVGIAVAILAVFTQAHPGRLDAQGGHHDRKHGGYHYHRGGPAERSDVPKTITTTPPEATKVSSPPSVAQPSLPTPRKSVPEKQGRIDVYFSPSGGCTEAIIREIEAAKIRVRIQAYSFTSQPIAKAVIDAKNRGVQVVAVLDKSNNNDKYSSATFLKNQGAKVYIDSAHAIAHNKIILIDNDVVITGSFNFSKSAEESNAENLLVIREYPALFGRYSMNFENHLQHSKPYKPEPGAASER